MRNALLVSALVGGTVSLLAVLSTRPHPAPHPKPDDGLPLAHPLPGADARLVRPDDALPAPSWVSERPIDGPPVSLTASDGSGLTLAAMRASAVVEGPLAFTEVHLAFDNPENRVREGTFKIVLPQGASLGRFAMKINDAWQEGEVVPKERARVAYEDALHHKQDPALLERGAGNEFTARVFPIPPHGRKELVVSYAQELVGGAPYALPLRGLPELGVLDVSVGGEGVTPDRMHKEHFMPTADFVMESAKRPSPLALRAGNLVVARVKPVAEAMPEPVNGVIVLVDTSASRALGLDAELRSVQALLQGLSARHATSAKTEIPVTVAAFDQEVVPIYQGDAKGFGQAEMDTLVSRRALGASNLEKALGWAKDEAKRTGMTRVVLVTDGVPTAGEDDGAKLAKAASALRDGGAERLDVVAVGGLRDDALARKLVTAGLAHDGVVVAANDGVATMVRRLEAGTKSDVAVAVEGASWSYPTHLDGVQPGDEVLVYAELAEGAPLRVKLGGGDVRALDATPVQRPLVERAWAQAKIASLESQERDHGKSPELERQIVSLSLSHRVLSAYTALLVLESDADYARFHIDRRALGDILSVNDGALAWTKRGDGSAETPRGGTRARTARDRRDLARTRARWTRRMRPPRRGSAGARRGDGIASATRRRSRRRADGAADGRRSAARRPGARGERAPAARRRREPMRAAAGLGAIAARRDRDARARRRKGRWGIRPRARERPPRRRSGARRGGRGSRGAVAAPPARRAATLALRSPSAAARGTLRRHGPPRRRRARRDRSLAAGARGSGAAASRAAPRERRAGVDPFTGTFKQVKDRLARNDAAGALDIASSWQSSEPGDVLALISLGETAEVKGDPTTAARAYGSIIDLFPSRADLRRFAGERLEHVQGGGALELAIDTFDKARRDRPDHPASHRLAAFARVRRGEYAAAFDILLAGLAQHYPEGRFRGVDRILREDLGLVAAAWMKADPAHKSDILARLRSAGGTLEDGPSIRFVLNWETDANDVDFHIHDAMGGHAYYGAPHLPSGGDLYADVTTGYGPECFTVREAKGDRAGPYTLQAHYYSRGPMGYGMGKLEIIDHDGKGGLKFEERPFVVMVDHAFVELGTVK